MKKLLLLVVAAAAVIAGTAFDIQSDNGKAGYTGSPNELLCDDCHSTYGNSNSGPGTIYLTSNMNNWQYTPGQTYTINVIVKQTGKPVFGLGFEALTTTNANSLVITNSVKTGIKTKTVSGVSRNNVVHQFNGGLSNDSAVFTFNWVAPATNIGNVKFYYSGIAGNNNGSDNGDYVYSSSKLITPASATGILENEVKSELKIFENSDNSLVLKYQSSIAAQPHVDLYDLSGHLVASRNFEQMSSGTVELEMERPLNLSKGVYIVNLISGADLYSGKVYLR